MEKFNDTLVVVGLIAIAIYYNDANLALAICTGLLGYLKGVTDAKKQIPS